MASRVRRFAANLVSGSLLSVATAALGIVVTPALIRLLGEERFGSARVLLDWFGYLALLEMGVVEATKLVLGAAAADDDRPLVTRTLAWSIRRFGRIAAVKLGAWMLLATVVTFLIPVRSSLASDLRRAAVVGALSIVVFPLAPFQILVEAEQRGYVLNVFLIGQAWLTSGLALLFAWFGWGITGQLAAMVAGALPMSLVLGWRGMRRHPGLVRTMLHSSSRDETPGALRRTRGAAFALGICTRLSVLTDNIFVAKLCGPELVTPFFVTQRLPLVALGHLQGIGNSIWAGLLDVRAREGEDAFRRGVTRVTRFVLVVAIALLGPIAAYDECFVAHWIRASAYAGHLVTILTCVNALCLALTSVWGWCFAGAGYYDRLVRLSVVGTAVNVSVSAVATRWLGLPGPAIGTSAMFVVTLPWWTVLLRNVLGVSLGELRRAVARPLALGAAFAGSLWFLARAFAPSGWAGLALQMSASVLTYVVAFLWLMVEQGDRLAWLARVRASLARGPSSRLSAP